MKNDVGTIRLRWRMDKAETGLRRMVAGPRGSGLYDSTGVRYAHVSALGRRRDGPWYWVAGWSSGVPHMNTCDAPAHSMDEAKAQALAYVKEHLKATP